MKTNMSIRTLLLLAVFLLLQLRGVNASAITVAAWSPSGLSGFGPSPFSATTTAADIVIGGLTRGSGISTSGTAAGNAWGGNGWLATSEATAISGNYYATFTITANSGYDVSLSTLSLSYRRSGTGASSGQLQYSLDGVTYTDVPGGALSYSSSSSAGSSVTPVDLSGVLALQNVPASTTITLRIVNWGGTSAAGTWYVYNSGLSVAGTVNVASGCSGSPLAGTITATPGVACGSTSSVLTLSGGSVATGISYQWSASATGLPGTFTDVAGATNLSYTTPTITSTTNYEVTSTCMTSSLSATAAPAAVVINPLPASISGVATICAGNTSLLANDSTGGTWSTGSIAVATISIDGHITGIAAGTSPVTYTLPTGCFVSTNISVNSLVTAPAVLPDSVAICSGASSAELSASPAIYAGGASSASGTINLSANTAATAFPAFLNISGIPAGATISNVSVTVNFTSSYLHDYIINLKAPNGNIINLAGQHAPAGVGGYAATIFSSASTVALSSSATPYSGTFAADEGLATGGGGYTSTTSDWADLYSVPNGTWTIIPDNVYTGSDIAMLTTWSITVYYTQPGTNTWSATTGLFLDSASITPYAGSASDTIYARPAATTVYTLTSAAGGCSAAFTDDVIVNPLPDAGAITGVATICPGATNTLTDTAAGGTWSTSDTSILNIDSAGIITGIVPGIATIYYTNTNSCGTAVDSVVVTVNPLPDAGTITGLSVVCATATTLLGDTVPGGIWSSMDTAVATIDTAGLVYGMAAGVTTVSYSVTNSCGTAIDTMVVTVNPLPDAGTITGTAIACPGSTTVLADTASGGSWSSADATVATIGATGSVTAIAAGTSMIYYTTANSCGTAVDSILFTVSPLPSAGTITGITTVCAGASISLTDTVNSGTWSVSSSAVASINPMGIVSGLAAGSDTVYYAVTNSCGTATDSAIITVNPLPDAGVITGTYTVCPSAITALADAAIGGAWSSATTSIATVSTAGVVTGMAAGATSVSYSVTNSCGTAVTTATVTVDPSPQAGAITGASVLCPTTTIMLADTSAGGTWSSLSAVIATISTSGIVSGLAAGTTTISYAVTNSCGTAAATRLITVNPMPAAGTITGTTTLCPSAGTMLTDAAAGGTWATADAGIATISTSGLLNGIAPGSSMVYYSVTNSCGTAVDSVMIVVNPLPYAGTVSGAAMICATDTISFTATVGTGVWSSVPVGIAAIDATGLVTGMSAGTATISYAVTNSCGTAAATSLIIVNPLPVAYSITGGGAYCEGATGLDLGLSGSDTGVNYQLYYGSAPAGSFLPGTGSPIDFGNYSDTGAYIVIATNPATSCAAVMTGTATVAVNPVVSPSVSLISSATNDTVCIGTTMTFTAVAVNGGLLPVYQWSINGSPVATTGNIYSYIPGNGDIVSVELNSSNPCAIPAAAAAFKVITVESPEVPSVAISTSANPACGDANVTFTATSGYGGNAPTYKWLVNSIAVATGAEYTCMPNNGDIFYCELYSNYACRTADSAASNSVHMHIITPLAPVVSIVAHPGSGIVAGTADTLIAIITDGGLAPAYQWQINGVEISGATTSTFVCDTLSNDDVVACMVTNTDPCGYTSFQTMIVHTFPENATNIKNDVVINVVPNPNNGSFTITGTLPGITDEDATAEMVNTFGQVVYNQKLLVRNGEIQSYVRLADTQSSGIYILNIYIKKVRYQMRVVVAR
jgi:hypothetical protein